MIRKTTMSADMSRRTFGALSGAALVSLVLPGCERRGDPPPQATPGSLGTVGERVELRCYKFRIINTGETPIVDVHIPLEGEVIAPGAPPGWGFNPEGDGIEFRTPPPGSGGATAPRPTPVKPGGSQGPFVFYLAVGTGDARSGPVEFSHPDGSRTPLDGRVEQGGEPVPLGDDGAYHIDKSGTAYCREIKITAPSDADVHDLHLERPPGGDPTKFVGVEPPSGWVANPVDPSIVTIFRPGGGAAIPAGGSATFKVYYEQVNAQPNWRMTDEQNRTIQGSEGSLTL